MFAMPIFTTSNVPILSLTENIDMAKIGLLELQRSFAWRRPLWVGYFTMFNPQRRMAREEPVDRSVFDLR